MRLCPLNTFPSLIHVMCTWCCKWYLFFAFQGDLKILGVPRNLDEAVLIIFLSQITMNLVSKLLFPHVEPESADAGADCRLFSAPRLGGGAQKGGLVYIILSFLVLFKALVISFLSLSLICFSGQTISNNLMCYSACLTGKKSIFAMFLSEKAKYLQRSP